MKKLADQHIERCDKACVTIQASVKGKKARKKVRAAKKNKDGSGAIKPISPEQRREAVDSALVTPPSSHEKRTDEQLTPGGASTDREAEMGSKAEAAQRIQATVRGQEIRSKMKARNEGESVASYKARKKAARKEEKKTLNNKGRTMGKKANKTGQATRTVTGDEAAAHIQAGIRGSETRGKLKLPRKEGESDAAYKARKKATRKEEKRALKTKAVSSKTPPPRENSIMDHLGALRHSIGSNPAPCPAPDPDGDLIDLLGLRGPPPGVSGRGTSGAPAEAELEALLFGGGGGSAEEAQAARVKQGLALSRGGDTGTSGEGCAPTSRPGRALSVQRATQLEAEAASMEGSACRIQAGVRGSEGRGGVAEAEQPGDDSSGVYTS